MKQCVFCGAELEDDARACNNCGRPVPDMPEKEPEKEPEKQKTEEYKAPEDPEDVQTPPEQPQQDQWAQQSVQDRNGQMQQQSPWDQQGQQGSWNPWGQTPQNPPQNSWNQPQQIPPQNQWNQPQVPPQDPWGRPQQNTPWGQQNNNAPYQGYQNQPNGFLRYNKFAIWALALGALAYFLNLFFCVASVAAIILGVIGWMQISKNPTVFKGKWMAILGVVLGVVFLIVYIQAYRMAFQILQDPESMKWMQQYLKEIGAGSR